MKHLSNLIFNLQILYRLGIFCKYGEKIKHYSSLKKEKVNRYLTIVDLLLLFLYVIKLLKESFSIHLTNFLNKTIFCVNINQVFDLQTLVNIIFFRLCIASIYLLIVGINYMLLKLIKSFLENRFQGLVYMVKHYHGNHY